MWIAAFEVGLGSKVYTGKELTRKEELRLKKAAAAVIVKGASSPERTDWNLLILNN